MKTINKILTSKWTKVFVFLLCLAPVAQLVWEGFHDELTANPIEYVTHFTGDYTLILLCLTLSITPARKLLKQPALIRFRRMLGLFAFFYVCIHFTIWTYLDKMFDPSAMFDDVQKRRFITVGFTGFALLIPLAVTSTAGWIRRLGGKRWRRLHQLIYVTACLGVIHYYWLVKSDVRKPLRYAAIVALLLLYRLWVWLAERHPAILLAGTRGKRLVSAPGPDASGKSRTGTANPIEHRQSN